MKFLFPAFLFALLAIAIPIIIHLFSFRRYRTVYFSHVGFLKDIKKESQKKSRLKQLLVLLARILTIAALVFAFAQPYIPANKEIEKGAEQVVGVYVDNSFSMNALSEQGQLLERARNKAVEIGQTYPPGTKFRLFTNDLDPKHQHNFNKEQFIRQVTEIQASPAVVSFSRIHNRFAQQISEKQDTEGNLYFISDFQRIVTDLENFDESEIFNYFLPLIPNQVNNLYIDSSWVEVPAHRLNQEENILVRIKNNSGEDYQNLPLKLYLNDSLKSITNFSVSAQNEIIASLKYTNASAGIQLGKIEITDYPFTYDNNWYISYHVEPKLKALAIYNDSRESAQGLEYISALFENDDYIELDEMSVQRMQISRLIEYNTIFLVNPGSFSSGFLNELAQIVANGTSVALFPGTENRQINNFLEQFNAARITGKDTTSQEISGIDFDNRFYEDVFEKREENPVLPEIEAHYKFRENIRTAETNLLWFQNGDKALSTLPFGEGNVWVFSFPLAEKNESFARNILFVPTIYNIVLSSLPQQQISYTTGKDFSVTLPESEKINPGEKIEIVNPEINERFIPEKNVTAHGIRIEFRGSIENDGHFLVQSGDETITALAFNYDRSESDLRYFETNELKEKAESENLKNAMVIENATAGLSEIFKEIQTGKQLWKWFILLALFFLVAEVLISRFMK
ncbi:MAG: BatA domain-containing protein [Prolixibacteraceae bacterium]